MLSSMTGFASVDKAWAYYRINIVLRSVNYRYLDIQIRLPENCRTLEPVLRDLIADKILRGKVECRIAWDPMSEEERVVDIDEAYLAHVLALSRQIQAQDKTLQPLSVGTLLHWPGVLRHPQINVQALHTHLTEGMKEALDQLLASRHHEGQKIQHFLQQHSQDMLKIIEAIQKALPQVLDGYLQKLQLRLKEALGHVNEERIQQEFTLFAQKIDVTEEIERLHMHLSALIEVVKHGGVIGKRLDFLMQELNREANTLAAKSVSNTIIHQSVDLKVLIEQMREQIQNIE
ncbi:MAG: YicC family protein [Neisseriales bacterium]|nr:MAG: YicC family protein [Neisseriales bacterium]